MSEQNNAVTVCKYCKSEIPTGAKICPNCRKKTGGKLKWILIGAIIALVLIIIIAAAGGSDTETGSKKVGEITASSDKNSNSDDTEKYRVGDILEDGDLRITFISAEEYKSDNDFLQPKDGNMYYRLEFEVENIGKSGDKFVSVYDFYGYADNVACDKHYEDDDLSATLSPGRKATGAVYFEVPEDAEHIEVEYESDFWTSKHLLFVVK